MHFTSQLRLRGLNCTDVDVRSNVVAGAAVRCRLPLLKDLIGITVAEDTIGLVVTGVPRLQAYVHEEPGNAVVALDLAGASLHFRQCQGVAVLVTNGVGSLGLTPRRACPSWRAKAE